MSLFEDFSLAAVHKRARLVVTIAFCFPIFARALVRAPEPMAPAGTDDNAVKLVGEKFFRDSRLSQFYFAHANTNLNEVLPNGDSAVSTLETLGANIENPYRGQSFSCASCHFVEQASATLGGGSRAYTDFARLSRVPDRGDGILKTLRNSPIMVASSLASGDYFLHYDGEFSSAEDLVTASSRGRNMGWLIGEEATAEKHIVSVIRQDNGKFPTDTLLGGLSYTRLYLAAADIPIQFKIPAEYRVDIAHATDHQVYRAFVHLVAGYLKALSFRKDALGHYYGSPFDVFLRKNSLPQGPDEGEDNTTYTTRLARLIDDLKNPVFVSDQDRTFTLHKQSFTFSDSELTGFKIFAGRGNCVKCHEAPDFTDHLFHTTGVSQLAYDSVHGSQSFLKLPVPDLTSRNQHFDAFLPASAIHPNALGIFRRQATLNDPLASDLGVWNIFLNPDMPAPQEKLKTAVCKALKLACTNVSDEFLLSQSIGMIKTPTLRDLGHTAPYLHDGSKDRIEDVLDFYRVAAELAKQELIRNADPALKMIDIAEKDIEPLANFLRALNEDYK